MLNRHYPFSILLAALLLPVAPVRSQSSTSQLSASPNATTSAAAAQSSASALGASRRFLAQGKYDDALAALHDLEGNDPRIPGLSHEFGVAYYKKGDYLNAIPYLKKAR